MILNAAAEVFAQHGFRGSTTRRIADAASVNEVTIFRYFGSKDALLQEAISCSAGTAFAHHLPSEPVDPERELGEWCTTLVKHLHARRAMTRKVMAEMEERPEMTPCAVQAPARATHELCSYFRKLRSNGFTDEDFDEIGAATMLRGALFHDAMARDMMPDVFPKPASKAAARYAQLILRAIGVRTGQANASTPVSTKTEPPTSLDS